MERPIPSPVISLSWLEFRGIYMHASYLLFESQLKAVPPAVRHEYDSMLLCLQGAKDHLEEVKAYYASVEEGKLL